MAHTTYLVFGDLHGRILPAFRLALAWQREHAEPVAGLLQVGDLGFFPDPARLDRATRRHAERDPLELGAMLVGSPSREADALFAEPDLPGAARPSRALRAPRLTSGPTTAPRSRTPPARPGTPR